MNILEARRRTLGKGVYKKTVEGNPAIAQGSLARMYPGITMQGWTTQDGTPTPEAPVPIVSAGTQNQDTGKWEYEITIANEQTDPDKNQTVTLTSDRPLTKWDKLEKRNGQWGWVYKSAEVVLDGSESWGTYAYVEISFTAVFEDCEQGYQTSFCDKYINRNTIWMQENVFCKYSDHPNRCNKYFKPPNADITTVEQWKTWLQSNNLTLVYETAEETFVPLSESEQEAMNALHTFRPTTVLSNDCECDMSLTYKTKKSLEVTT